MISPRILNLLEKAKVKYKIVEHKKVFTAFDKAKTLKISPQIVGKTVIIKGKKQLFLFLIPANKNLDLKKIKKKIKEEKIKIASEKLIKNKMKGVKLGAIPPFGILWKIPTFVDKSFLQEKKIIVNSGQWNFSLEIFPKDFQKIIPNLIWGSFSKKK